MSRADQHDDQHAEQHTELRQLLAQMCDGELSDESTRRLDALLRDDPQAQAIYLQYLALDVELAWDSQTPSLTDEALRQVLEETSRSESALDQNESPAAMEEIRITPTLRSTPAGRQYWQRHPVYFWTVVSALTLLLAVGFFTIWSGPFGTLEPVSEKETSPSAKEVVARITDSFNPVWGEESEYFRVRRAVLADDLVVLKSGLVELTFEDGAVVLLEGPAALVAGTVQQGTLKQGKLTALVPQQAAGFTIHTPAGGIVDLGTEFGVSVSGDREIEVVVFQGEVKIVPQGIAPSHEPCHVTAGQLARTSGVDGTWHVQPQPTRLARQYPRRFSTRADDTSTAAALPVTSGLRIWLDALNMDADDTFDPLQGSAPLTDGQPIGVWRDSSCNSNDARGSASPAPTYVANGLNGNPVVRFGSGADQFTFRPVNAQTIVAYVRVDPGIKASWTELVGNRTDRGIRRSRDGGLTGWRGITTSIGDFTFTDGSGFYVNGVETESHSPSTTAFSIVSAIRGGSSLSVESLGYYTIHSRYFVGDVAELLIYDRALTRAERESVESYLTEKWANGVPLVVEADGLSSDAPADE